MRTLHLFRLLLLLAFLITSAMSQDGASDDPLYQTVGNYYINTQVGEDLVTNPGAQSTAEEILLSATSSNNYTIVGRSNQVEDDTQILTPALLRSLRLMLRTVHSRFRALYGFSSRDQFAMEMEFKITADGSISIKQARPWVH